MSAAPFRVLLRMDVKPGKAEEFVAAWTENSAAVTGHPANLGQSLSRSTEEPDVFYIFSEWASEEGFREFEDSPGHLEHRAQLHPFRSGGSIAFLDLVAEVRGGARPEQD
ncbi:antibiotic biosynthesis monooxygenase family protein [Nocardiopsis potens]|uniref:antibiotic biosynthesis monooxygenase family protein n=1 Tax=Nocardiopsis potens TaxID=1246458 RepID=UPI000345E076|nr:antibiotic biosynthesis monooxygenase family protein [Nocardiopsis potens]